MQRLSSPRRSPFMIVSPCVMKSPSALCVRMPVHASVPSEPSSVLPKICTCGRPSRFEHYRSGAETATVSLYMPADDRGTAKCTVAGTAIHS